MNTLLIIAFSSLCSRAAYADCGKDTDCKGDRVCNAGTCTNPNDAAPPPAGKSSKTTKKAKKPARESIVWVSRGHVRIGDGGTVSINEARPLLNTSTEASAYLEKSKSQRTSGSVILWSGVGMAAVGAIVSATERCEPYYSEYSGYIEFCDTNAVIGVPMIVVGLGVGLGVGLPLSGASVRNEQRAVRAYADGVSLRVDDRGAVASLSGRW